MVTASQSFDMYELLNKYVSNHEDARSMVFGIENIVDVKIANEKIILATKEDLRLLELRTKDDIKQLEIRMELGFKETLKWMITLMIGFSSLIIALIKIT